MRKRYLAVGLIMLVASAVSYELVHLTGASRAAVEVVEAAPSGMGIHAAAAPLVMPARVPESASTFESMSDAALLGATGAALFVIAAGVRRRAS